MRCSLVSHTAAASTGWWATAAAVAGTEVERTKTAAKIAPAAAIALPVKNTRCRATFFNNASVTDLLGSLVKCTLFGAIIAIVCCYKGMTASGGAAGVGRAVNREVPRGETGAVHPR